MPQRGRLTLEAINVALDQATATQFVGITPGPYIKLTLTDDGLIGQNGGHITVDSAPNQGTKLTIYLP